MTVVPVIGRELHASARQPFTYYLRVLGAAALLVASVLFGLSFGFDPSMGRLLFSALHATLFGAIWVLVPMLTADCISRERREGTLGLLFLTPLTGADIVVAKGVAHGLRAVTLGLAVLPILTISFLLGGVSWTDALLSVVLNSNAMCLALAAGLLASAWSKSWLRALMLAGILAFALLIGLVWVSGWLILQAAPAAVVRQFGSDFEHVLPIGTALLATGGQQWGYSTRWLPPWHLTWAIGQITALSVFALLVAVAIAGRRIRRSGQEEPPSPRRLWWRRKFCTPVLWLTLFRRWMRRKLERNPVGWLEQRTWSGRLVTWGWLAVMVSLYSLLLTDRTFFTGGGDEFQQMLAWLLAGSMAMSAAGSFRRERECGVLELLLVSPLGESHLINGRLGGLWSQFVPAAALLLGIWAYSSTFIAHDASIQPLFFFTVTFVTVPVFGLYFSLRCRNFLTAFMVTVAVALVLPVVLAEALRWLWWWGGYSRPMVNFDWDMGPTRRAAIYQGILAVVCWDRMYLRLKRRDFPFQRAQGLAT